MVQHWPAALCSTYCLAILQATSQVLQCLLLASVSPETTLKQLCQGIRCTTGLMDIAGAVQHSAIDSQVLLVLCRLPKVVCTTPGWGMQDKGQKSVRIPLVCCNGSSAAAHLQPAICRAFPISETQHHTSSELN